MRGRLGKILTVRDKHAERGTASGLRELLGVVERGRVTQATRDETEQIKNS